MVAGPVVGGEVIVLGGGHGSVTVAARYGDMAVTWLVEPDRMDPEAAVQVRILGPIEVVESGGEMPLTPQLRRLLALLVVANGGYVLGRSDRGTSRRW